MLQGGEGTNTNTGCPKKNFPSEFSRWTIKNPFYVKFTFDRQVTIIKDFQGFSNRCPAEGSVKAQMERDRLKWSEMSELFERMHPGPP